MTAGWCQRIVGGVALLVVAGAITMLPPAPPATVASWIEDDPPIRGVHVGGRATLDASDERSIGAVGSRRNDYQLRISCSFGYSSSTTATIAAGRPKHLDFHTLVPEVPAGARCRASLVTPAGRVARVRASRRVAGHEVGPVDRIIVLDVRPR